MLPRAGISLLMACVGCHATFVDDRPGTLDLAQPRIDLAGLDLGGVDLAGGAVTFARGTFEGRDGHSGSGPAELVRLSDGSVELRFGAAFVASGVPGPVVVLSSRDDMGTTIDSALGDLSLGTLISTRGEQSYPVPGDDGRRVAFVFCKPFGVEVARAILTDVQ
jgi:hypothetical protein